MTVRIVTQVVGLFVLAVFAVGCASIINGTTQDVGFRSVPSGATVSVSGQSAVTPTKFKLARSQDHTVTFTKDGYPDRQANLKQKLDGAFYGNIALGGIIGMAVDMGNGAAYHLSPSNVEMDMETGIARKFDDDEPIRVAATSPPPSAPAMPAASAAPAGGTAGIGSAPVVAKGVVYHPDTGKPVDCPILLNWKLEDRSDGIKSAEFNRQVGGDRAVLAGLTPQQLTVGMALRDACREAASPPAVSPAVGSATEPAPEAKSTPR